MEICFRNYKKLKLVADKVFALFLLLFLSPLLSIIGILIFFDLGNPIFFKQKRIGYNNKSFILIKYRTMNNKRDKYYRFLDDEKRVTKLGKFLRSSSLDELPSLINVLRGEMSFVGPRPLLVEYLKLYNKEQSRRHAVVPGITGLAQISGRNKISWDNKLTLDVAYVDKISFFLDLKILIITFFKVLNKKDISFEEKFRGN